MEVYCGTDIIEVERIKKAILENSKFKDNIFSTNEIEDIEKCENEEYKYQRYAGRFAAKEAIYKAISRFVTESEYTAKFLDVEIINDDELKRRPKIIVLSPELKSIFEKYNIINIDLSISHVKEMATAMAVVSLEK